MAANVAASIANRGNKRYHRGKSYEEGAEMIGAVAAADAPRDSDLYSPRRVMRETAQARRWRALAGLATDRECCGSMGIFIAMLAMGFCPADIAFCLGIF